MNNKLSPRLQSTLFAVHRFQIANGYMPTIRELAIETNYSRGAACVHVNKLIELGFLSRTFGAGRRSLKFSSTISSQGKCIPLVGVCS